MSRLAALLLLVPLACDRTEADAPAESPALQQATEELAAARTAFAADQAATRQALAELKKAVDATNAKLDALAAERGQPVRAPTPVPTDPLMSVDGALEPLEDPLAASVRCASETRCTVDRVLFDTLARDPTMLVKQARIVPSQLDGVVQGYKLYGIRRGSLPKALGLKNGDLVRSINGKALGSLDEVMKLLTKLRSETTFTLGIERKGTPLTLTVEVVDGP
jgi:PDZ domain